MLPRIASGTRPRGRPRTRSMPDEPNHGIPEDEAIDRDEDEMEDDPDWDSEEVNEEDIQEARQEQQEYLGMPPAPAVPQMLAVDPTQFFQLMFQQMQRAASAPQQPTHTDYLALALPHRPPTFSGGTDPAVLDDWICKMARIFRHIGCPGDRKVEVAVQFLDGPACSGGGQLRVLQGEMA